MNRKTKILRLRKNKKRIKEDDKERKISWKFIWAIIGGIALLVSLFSDTLGGYQSARELEEVFEQEKKKEFSQQSKLKILILPFRQLCLVTGYTDRDVGEFIELRLKESLNQYKAVKVEVLYLEEEKTNQLIGKQRALSLQQNKKADIVIYGGYQGPECSSYKEGEYCLNYNVSDAWSEQQKNNFSTTLTPYSSHDILNGNLSGDVEELVLFFTGKILIQLGFRNEGYQVYSDLYDKGFKDYSLFNDLVHAAMIKRDYQGIIEYSDKEIEYAIEKKERQKEIRARWHKWSHFGKATKNYRRTIDKLLDLEKTIYTQKWEADFYSGLIYMTLGQSYASMGMRDTAYYYFDNAPKYCYKHLDCQRAVYSSQAIFFSNIRLDKAKKALINAKWAIEESKNENIQQYHQQRIQLFKTQAQVYTRIKQYDKAEEYLLQAMTYIKRNNLSERPMLKLGVYDRLHAVASKKGDVKMMIKYNLKRIEIQHLYDPFNKSNYAVLLVNTGHLYYQENELKSALFITKKAYNYVNNNLEEIDKDVAYQALYDYAFYLIESENFGSETKTVLDKILKFTSENKISSKLVNDLIKRWQIGK